MGYQLYVSLAGEVAADEAAGRAGPDAPMGRDTLVPWMSASKPLTAVAIAQLWEQGLLDLDDPVARHLPAFAQGGKESITLRHLLTHTAGLAEVETGWPGLEWDQIIAALCAAVLPEGFRPGREARYHPASSWFLLGEIVRRLSGEPVEHYLRRRLFEPLGMFDSHLAMPRAQAEAYGSRLARMMVTRRPPPKPAPESMPYLERSDRCSPGSTARGPMRELARFYEMLLQRGQAGPEALRRSGSLTSESRLLLPPTIEALTARHRAGLFDGGFQRVMDWGLGFVLSTPREGERPQPYGFGRHASPRTFGHGGHQSSNAFADPEHRLAVAWLCNGQPGPAAHDQRNFEINTAIYEDLGLGQA